MYLAVADLVVEDAQRLGVLGGDDDAAGVAVDAVAQRGGEGVFLARPPFALLGEVGLDVGDERVVVPDARAVAQHARLFVGKEDVLVLVNDRKARRADLEVGVFLARLFKEFIVDIKLQHVAFVQVRIPFGALAVELDALEADVLLQQRFRQQGNGFPDKAVEPLAGVVFLYNQLFHDMSVRLKVFCFLHYTIQKYG